MRAIAHLMSQQGWEISGSDTQADIDKELSELSSSISPGHAASNVPTNGRVVIYSEAVPRDNVERRRAAELGITTQSYAESLAKIAAGNVTLAVAGTHGKSTVVAMVAEILCRAGIDPTVVCGAAPASNGTGGIGPFGGRHGHGQFALVEACEYRENFLHLRPNVAMILNIEPDHFDFFQSLEQLESTFVRFVQQVPPEGLLIVSEACPSAMAIAGISRRQTVTFGFSKDAAWRAINLEHSRGKYGFDIVRHGRRLTPVTLGVPGKHNVLNALAAAALARHCGASSQQIANGLNSFRGLNRRLEQRGYWGAARWIDDYAHHPTEVAASLATVRQMFPRRRLWCVIQPHQASRLKALLDELAASLHNVDKLAIAEVYRAREGAPTPGEATAADLAARLKRGGADVLAEHHPTEIARRLAIELEPNDVLVTMGAGDLGKIFNQFHERLRRNYAAA